MATTKKGGKKSRTEWELLKERDDLALLLCRPLTGRTHQIRLHLSSMCSPICGDRDYGKREGHTFALRPLLHAYRLSFPHPVTNELVEWVSHTPKDFPMKPSDSGAKDVQD